MTLSRGRAPPRPEDGDSDDDDEDEDCAGDDAGHDVDGGVPVEVVEDVGGERLVQRVGLVLEAVLAVERLCEVGGGGELGGVDGDQVGDGAAVAGLVGGREAAVEDLVGPGEADGGRLRGPVRRRRGRRLSWTGMPILAKLPSASASVLV